jgi:outer membrane scaffolding protein for murein synthesis (MipA/OmpV family)
MVPSKRWTLLFNRGTRMKSLGPCAIAAICLPASAFAQSGPPAAPMPSPQEVASKDTITIGLGGAFVPDYEGSNDYRLLPVGAIRGKVGGITFMSRGSYLYVDLVPPAGKVSFNAGPIVGLRLNSRRNIKDEVVKLLPRRKRAIEVGGFAGVTYSGLTNPYDSLDFRVDVLHDIGSAHQSTVISPNIDFSTPLSTRTYASLSLGAEFVSNKFADYYYSITPADSLATGGQLPAFNADGGMKNWKAGLLLNQSITGNLLHGFSIFGYGEYSRLVGDFKRSPIVAQRGSPSQWTGALGLAYTW